MQGTRLDGRRRIAFDLIYLFVFISLLILDQFSKIAVANKMVVGESICVLPNFFDIRYVRNSGAAWSFLADVSWGQTFFKVLTVIALIAFTCYYVFVCKKGYKFLRVGVLFIIAGTIGNFIDRVAYGEVIDFLAFTLLNGYKFPVFNMADTFLTVGIIMAIIHYLFLDKDKIIPIKNEKQKV